METNGNGALKLQIDEPYIVCLINFYFAFFKSLLFVLFCCFVFCFFAFFYFIVVAVRSIEIHEYLRVRGILFDP